MAKVEDFGAEYEEITDPIVALSYYPTRLEYFAGKALQGLCTGRSEKDLGSVVRKSIMLARQMESDLDSAQG